MAQKKNLTFEHLVPGGKQYARLSPQFKAPKLLNFYGNDYIYLLNDTVYKVFPDKNFEKKIWFTTENLNQIVKNYGIPQLKQIPSFSIQNTAKGLVVRISYKNYIFDFSPDNKKINNLYTFNHEDENTDYNPQKECYAFTQGNGLYLLTKNGKRICIAKDSDKNISYGSNYIYRNEFGQKKGTFWSPQGNALAFYRMDESNVAEYPIVNISTNIIAQSHPIKYPMAGQKSHTTSIGIYRPETNETIYLKTGAPEERYLTNLTWSPDEKEIYLQELNRQQDTCRLVAYSSETGERLRILFTETHAKYTEPEFPLTFIPGKSDQFLLLSRRDGYRHIYLYNTSGKLIRQLTQGPWEVTSIYIPDNKKNTVYIGSTESSPLETNFYVVNITNGKRTPLTTEHGVHKIIADTSGQYIIDQYSNHNTPLIQQFIDTKSGKKHKIFSAEDPYKNYNYPQIETGTIKANDDSTDLYFRMVKPLNFDPNHKYPVIVYVYGGPHAQMIKNSWKWDVRGFDIYMAQKGYIVFTLDNRGSANRGLEFENITHRQLGKIESEDQITGIEFLKKQPFVDTDRIGVHGWSFGGFMTTYLLTHYPQIFKTGVAGGPVIDWSFYEIMYGERYMGTPQNNPEGYKNSNLNNFSKNLKGRLLLIHGDEDPVVVWQNSLSFLKSCIKNRTYPDYFVYPGHVHNVIGPDRVHLHEIIARYFDDHLK